MKKAKICREMTHTIILRDLVCFDVKSCDGMQKVQEKFYSSLYCYGGVNDSLLADCYRSNVQFTYFLWLYSICDVRTLLPVVFCLMFSNRSVDL